MDRKNDGLRLMDGAGYKKNGAQELLATLVRPSEQRGK